MEEDVKQKFLEQDHSMKHLLSVFEDIILARLKAHYAVYDRLKEENALIREENIALKVTCERYLSGENSDDDEGLDPSVSTFYDIDFEKIASDLEAEGIKRSQALLAKARTLGFVKKHPETPLSLTKKIQALMRDQIYYCQAFEKSQEEEKQLQYTLRLSQNKEKELQNQFHDQEMRLKDLQHISENLKLLNGELKEKIRSLELEQDNLFQKLDKKSEILDQTVAKFETELLQVRKERNLFQEQLSKIENDSYQILEETEDEKKNFLDKIESLLHEKNESLAFYKEEIRLLKEDNEQLKCSVKEYRDQKLEERKELNKDRLQEAMQENFILKERLVSVDKEYKSLQLVALEIYKRLEKTIDTIQAGMMYVKH